MLVATASEAPAQEFYLLAVRRGFVINIKHLSAKQAQLYTNASSKSRILMRTGVPTPKQLKAWEELAYKGKLGVHASSLSDGQQQRLLDYLDRASPEQRTIVASDWNEWGVKAEDTQTVAAHANLSVPLLALATEQQISEFYATIPALGSRPKQSRPTPLGFPMYKQLIQDTLRQLALSEGLKARLSADATLDNYSFYLKLPRYLAPLFPLVTAQQVLELTRASYLYFSHILATDKVLDEPGTGAQDTGQRLLDTLELQEQAVRLLSTLFGVQDMFWVNFTACKQWYRAANLQEKKDSRDRPALSEQHYEEQAAGKAAFVIAPVYALCSLGKDDSHSARLIECLSGIVIGDQYFDDITDFRQDYAQQQYTYAHYRTERYLRELGHEVAAMPVAMRHRYLFSSGVATDMMNRGQQHYSASLQIAQQLGLLDLAGYLERQLARYGQQQAEVEQNLASARIAC